VTRPVLSLTAAELSEAGAFLALLRAGGWPEENMRIRYGAGGIDEFSASVDIGGRRSVLFRAILTAGGKVAGYAAMAYNTGDLRLNLREMPLPLRQRDISYADFARLADVHARVSGWQRPD
jgi:hypothetical protein